MRKNKPIEWEEQIGAFDLQRFIEKGEWILRYQGDPVVLHPSYTGMFRVHKGALYGFGCGVLLVKKPRSHQGSITANVAEQLQRPPSAAILPLTKTKLTANSEKCKMPLLLNGDQGYRITPINSLVEDREIDFGFPTVSFQCLLLLTKAKMNKLTQMLHKGTLEILDFNPDEQKPLTAEQKELKKSKKFVAPSGWTVINNTLHRSATVLFKNHETGAHYLVGQDEGTYFGCELKGTPRTIADAFQDLTPPEANVVGVIRQGEWFMVPVDKSEVPTLEECIAVFDDESSGWSREANLALPVDDPNSNRHRLGAIDGRISAKGVFALEPTLFHEEHEQVDGKCRTWYTFYRNTAVRSVSVEGVD
jgi:hypothetical protein